MRSSREGSEREVRSSIEGRRMSLGREMRWAVDRAMFPQNEREKSTREDWLLLSLNELK